MSPTIASLSPVDEIEYRLAQRRDVAVRRISVFSGFWMAVQVVAAVEFVVASSFSGESISMCS